MCGQRLALFIAIGTVALSAPACSSSSKTASDPEPTVGTAPGPTVPDDESCPFSGTTDSQREPGAGKATTLAKVEPTTQGCIDQVMFDFSPALAQSVTAYASPAPSGGGAVLEVTLSDTTLGDGIPAGTKLNPTDLSYVSQVEQTTAAGNLVWRITLDKQRPFLVSSSEVPPQLVIAVG